MVWRGMAFMVAAAWVAGCGASTLDGASGAASVPTCGGDLLGTWWGADPHFRPHDPPPPADPCYQLAVYPQPDGTFGAISRWPGPERREAKLTFQAANFTWAISDRGPVTIAYAASCLAKTTPRPTCQQLAAGLLVSGLGEGSVRKVDCVAVGDGCTCTFSVFETGGRYGQWSAADGLVTLVSYAGTPEERRVVAPYCTDGSSLRFGAAIDAFTAGLSRMTFEPENCTDGKQGPLEDGIDCGFYCPTMCP